nr:ribonuclease H-like domain-containing protein [Tanacetum cinerariifolium]
MDIESAQNNAIAKLPLLKHGDYEMWKLKIEQYFQVQDYALWDIIENGNSFKPVPRTTANVDGTSTSTILGLVTTQEKAQKKNDVKAKSILLMALPNEHILTFSQYKDAKTLFESIQARFGVNDATKKTQRTLLKQMYENFNAPCTDTPISIVSSHDNTANLSDASVYAFLANQPNGSQLVHEDLEQIHEDDLEEMDLKSDTTGYDKTTVECFNCHKMGHFARECRSPKNQESRARNQDRSRKLVNVEDTTSKAMVAIDGAGFDWSYMADDEVPTSMALMAFTYSEIGFLMVQKPMLKTVEKGMVQREVRLVWDNAMRTNHQNFSNSRRNFAPIAVLTKSSIVPISTARQTSSRATAPVSVIRPINTDASKPLVNVAKPRQSSLQTSHSLSRRPFYQQIALKNRNLNNNVNTAKANSINTAKGNKVTSAVGTQGINAVKSSACWVWRPKIKVQNHVSKNRCPQDSLKDQGYFDKGCSRLMTRNISYLADFKDHDRGYVACGGGAKGGKITSKGIIRT